jgi:hypothetical protein
MFSELIDSSLVRSGRPSKLLDATAFLLGSIRECETLDYCAFRKSLIEDTITATADPHIFIPTDLIRIVQTVKYPAYGIFPKFIPPGRRQLGEDYYYYGAGNYYVFEGAAVDDEIDIAYYIFQPALLYYEIGERPAVFHGYPTTAADVLNDTGDWLYLQPDNSYAVSLSGGATAEEAARALVTNWLLDGWRHVLAEGIHAKILNDHNDDRAPKSFALYKSYQKDLKNAENHVSLMQ